MMPAQVLGSEDAEIGQAEAWFVAQLKPNCFQLAERNLRRQGFTTFMPSYKVTDRARGRGTIAVVPKPLFPGYLFVALNVGAGHWRAINSTHGVARLVSFGDRPAEVSVELIAELRLRSTVGATSARSMPALKPGDDVSLRSGPFADFVATVESVTPERRVWLLLDLMGRQTRVMAQLGDVRSDHSLGA